jgi:DNA-binding CsgD family transcriptional regulator
MKQTTPAIEAHPRFLGTDVFNGLSRNELLAVLGVMHRILEANRKHDLARLVTELPTLFPRRARARNGQPNTHEKQSMFDASSNGKHTYRVFHYVFSCLSKAQAKMKIGTAKAGRIRVDHHGRQLSPRELMVLLWMKEGKTNWEIARILGLRERTIRFHIGGIFKKLDVKSRTQAVARALGTGLITP